MATAVCVWRGVCVCVDVCMCVCMCVCGRVPKRGAAQAVHWCVRHGRTARSWAPQALLTCCKGGCAAAGQQPAHLHGGGVGHAPPNHPGRRRGRRHGRWGVCWQAGWLGVASQAPVRAVRRTGWSPLHWYDHGAAAFTCNGQATNEQGKGKRAAAMRLGHAGTGNTAHATGRLAATRGGHGRAAARAPGTHEVGTICPRPQHVAQSTASPPQRPHAGSAFRGGLAVQQQQRRGLTRPAGNPAAGGATVVVSKTGSPKARYQRRCTPRAAAS